MLTDIRWTRRNLEQKPAEVRDVRQQEGLIIKNALNQTALDLW